MTQVIIPNGTEEQLGTLLTLGDTAFDTTSKVLRVGDGTTPGGVIFRNADYEDPAIEEISNKLDNPRVTSLARADRKQIVVVKGGVFQGGQADTTGAFQCSLPGGVNDARNNVITVVVFDNYGRYELVISGNNNPNAWDYATVTVSGFHQFVPKPNIRLGKDSAGRYCFWIGDKENNLWAYPQIWIKSVLYGGNIIPEAWAGQWDIKLVADYGTVQTGPIVPIAALTDQYVKVDAQRLAVAVGSGAKTGTRPSNYQVAIGALAGTDSLLNFNNVFIGLQCGGESDGTSATTFVGLQAGQHAKQVINGTGIAIHALLSLEIGANMTAVGAGSQEYVINANRVTSLGAYSFRDNKASGGVAIGNNAALYSTTEENAFHIANNENESLLRGNFGTRYLNVNGALSSEGLKPLADNTFSLGSSALRFSVVYAGSGAINTSDERMKRDISAIPDEWLDAWGEVEWCRFRFVDGSRWHIGLIAQRVHAAFEAHGLDAFDIGLCCRDVWEEETEKVTELRPVVKIKQRPKITNGVPEVEMIKGGELEDGTEVLVPSPVLEDYEDVIQQMFETGEIRVTREAGDLWGLRYDECFAMQAAYDARRMQRLEAALAELVK